jgi:tetratricopeptide (TPR) repeat protein
MKGTAMSRNQLFWAVMVLLVSAFPASLLAADARSDYGVTLAISGEEAQAESLFITMLSHTRGDARALNNLGNIRLLRGESRVARAFYERALRGDSLDAGIHLNHATALLMLGDKAGSEKAFALGVKLAGGVEQARALLGISPESPPADERAAKKTAIDAELIRAMLKQAASTTPTGKVEPASSGAQKSTGENASAWRSAGPRGSDAGETPQILYWKR